MQSKRCKCVKYGRGWGGEGDEGSFERERRWQVESYPVRSQAGTILLQSLTTSLCCSLDKCKIGSRVKSYISSSIHIYWLQSTHDACSAVIWLIKRGLCIHSITNSRLLASALRCIDGIPYQEEFCLLHWGHCDVIVIMRSEGGIVIWHLWQIQTQRHGIFVRTGNTTRLLSFIVSLNIVITSQDKHDE